MLSTWGLFKESLKLMLDGIPQNVDLGEVQRMIELIPEVDNMHHIHVWGLSSTINALTAHVVLSDNYPMSEQVRIKNNIKHKLEHVNIQHATIEFDGQEGCNNPGCN
jgi:cobalt-zinc-cadmium efflux system protein